MLLAGVAAQHLWRDAYVLDDAVRPSFVSPALATAILRAGKSLLFLRCGFLIGHFPACSGHASANMHTSAVQTC